MLRIVLFRTRERQEDGDDVRFLWTNSASLGFEGCIPELQLYAYSLHLKCVKAAAIIELKLEEHFSFFICCESLKSSINFLYMQFIF